MYQLVKLLPLLLTGKNKKWFVVIAVLFSGYQLLSPNGIGADLGVTSIDTYFKEPREILVDRVEDARDGQQQTAEQFQSALEKFKAVTRFESGDLEKQFNTLSAAFKRSESAAKELDDRVDRVVNATNSLLREWREELNDYHDANIKRKAEQRFDETRLQADSLIRAMRTALQKTKPVLAAFRDQVLFLKHNLNSQAINSVSEESAIIEQDVSLLIDEMQKAVDEAEAFIKSIKS